MTNSAHPRYHTESTTPAASPALLLTSATELIVAPKSRHAPPPAVNKTHDLTSTAPSTAPVTSPEWDALKRKLVRLLPLASVHAELASSSCSVEHLEALVCPALYRALKGVLPSLRVNLLHHARPVARGSASAAGGEAGPSTATTGASAGGKEEEASKEEKRKEVEVRLRESSAVPVGHVWVGEAARVELGLAVAGEGTSEGGFELLRYVTGYETSSEKSC